MPNNEVSIREWTKHISTLQRNYKDNLVIFQVDCSDHKIYAALQEQFDKIQNAINYCQKTIRAIPFIAGRRFELKLSVVDVKYNFKGFNPKGIRFSFDVQNVVKAFIGEDLYKDKLTALREAIQNSIDSCRYKVLFQKGSYSPHIEINLREDSIEIVDNGTGMDEFIVENFFSKLGSSFYEQEKVKDKFEAIGQFGVGVFSYFLISEYIDIETKTENTETLKFRFDDDPKSYFHFYDKFFRDQTGTTIIMHLKEQVRDIIADSIERYVMKMFLHIEMPIILNTANSTVTISDKGFVLDSDREIRDRLKLQNRHLAENFVVKCITIDDEDVEGICGMILSTDLTNVFSVRRSLFDYEQFLTVRHGSMMSQYQLHKKEFL